MRTIKFRGKDIESGQWAIGDLHTLCDKPHIHTEHTSFPFAGKRSFVNPDTIGQYTGLKDKNGNDIYEGDIVTHGDGRSKYVVVFDKGAFCLDDKSLGYTVYLGGYDTIDLSVIGNIHDTPELLENK